jgi:hypothetical protein
VADNEAAGDAMTILKHALSSPCAPPFPRRTMTSPSSSKLGLSPGPPAYRDATERDSPTYRADADGSDPFKDSAPVPDRGAGPSVFARLLKPPAADDGLGGLGCRPSEDFWLPDGSAVLVCGAVGFRVHASVLCMHAGAFREVLAPDAEDRRQQQQQDRRQQQQQDRRQHERQQQKAQERHAIAPPCETFDGCLVLRLPDAPADMRCFLRALYDRSCVAPSPSSACTPTESDASDRYLADKRAHSLFELGSVLQLATTYRARALRAELAQHVTALFPTSRAALAAQSGESAIASAQLDLHPLLGVELARRCALPQLLPAALLGAARLPLGAVLDGFRLADGRWVRLAPEGVRAAVEFREALGALVERAVYTPDAAHGWTPDGEGTAAHTGCAGVGRGLVRALEARYRRLECALVCGSVLESSAPSLGQLRKLCAGCQQRVREWEDEVQDRVWEGLPGACGIAGWQALRAAGRADSEWVRT